VRRADTPSRVHAYDFGKNDRAPTGSGLKRAGETKRSSNKKQPVRSRRSVAQYRAFFRQPHLGPPTLCFPKQLPVDSQGCLNRKSVSGGVDAALSATSMSIRNRGTCLINPGGPPTSFHQRFRHHHGKVRIETDHFVGRIDELRASPSHSPHGWCPALEPNSFRSARRIPRSTWCLAPFHAKKTGPNAFLPVSA